MDQDLDDLRRRAFSRHGTVDDLRLLAEADERPPGTEPPSRVEPRQAVSPPADVPPEHEAAPSPPPAPRASRRAVVVAAILGAVGGIAVGVWGVSPGLRLSPGRRHVARRLRPARGDRPRRRSRSP